MTTGGDLSSLVQPLRGSLHDYDTLMEEIGNCRLVLIGEDSHGSHEFYRERAVLTKRLIEGKGFSAVAIEGDWPDASRVHRYVTGEPGDADAVEALSGFERFPSWMWRNADVLDFVGWLREHNDRVADRKEKTGFYGLDLYSLHASIAAVLEYPANADPSAPRHRERQPHDPPASTGPQGIPRRTGTARSSGSRARVKTRPSRSSSSCDARPPITRDGTAG